MTEVLFYSLQHRALEDALPALLERCLERGWRVVVQTGSDERRDALDQHLWTYAEESFLPHGTPRDGDPALQPVLLTSTPEDRNGGTVRFLVDRAVPPPFDGYERVVFLFDEQDEAAREEARAHWRAAKAAGHAVTFWQEDERGRWVKRA